MLCTASRLTIRHGLGVGSAPFQGVGGGSENNAGVPATWGILAIMDNSAWIERLTAASRSASPWSFRMKVTDLLTGARKGIR